MMFQSRGVVVIEIVYADDLVGLVQEALGDIAPDEASCSRY